jgi:hypothetical protein
MKNKNTIQNNFIKTIAIIFALTVIISGLSISAFAVAPPGNDNFANAEVLSGIQVHISRDNNGATKEAGEPNHAFNVGGKSVWFKWTATMSRIMTFSTSRSATNLDTLVHIYRGTVLNSLVSETFNNNISSPINNKSCIRFQVKQGLTYYIAVDGSNDGQGAAEGTFQLDIQPDFNIQGADYDTDGMTDLSYFRPSDGTWHVFNSSDGQIRTKQWGLNGDIPLISANGTNNDQSVYRPSDGTWYQQDCCQSRYVVWGTNDDIPVPANFGGGINTEAAVFRPSNGTWYIRYSENDFRYYQFGLPGDIPVAGHYSPDSYADVAVFRPSNGVWYFIKRPDPISGTDSFAAVQFGLPGDKPVPADYDGDGILDVAVFRPSTGTWWVLRSSDNQSQTFQWGIAEDIPTTGDFDGDGISDYAVFRPSNGTWYVFRSGDNSIQIKQFGQTGDIPITANKTF